MRRRRSLEAYDRAVRGDIELLLAPGVAEHAERVALTTSRFLWFTGLKAAVALPGGVTLGRRASLV